VPTVAVQNTSSLPVATLEAILLNLEKDEYGSLYTSEKVVSEIFLVVTRLLDGSIQDISL
jgi:hypothetical protein